MCACFSNQTKKKKKYNEKNSAKHAVNINF